MQDFTVRVSNLPYDLDYKDNEHVLRAALWEHFEKILAPFGDTNIVDVCFARRDIQDVLDLMDLQDHYIEVMKQKNSNQDAFSDKIEEADTKYRREKAKLLRKLKKLR